MGQPNLTIKSGKETEFEFDVMIQGAVANEASVRFVIESVEGYDVTVNCVHRNTDKWLAKIPPLNLNEGMQKFRIEVITGDYYFCPTSGMMKVVANPRVAVAETFTAVNNDRPVVLAAGLPDHDGAIAPQRKTVVVEKLNPAARSDLLKRCVSAGRIFAKAGEVMQDLIAKENAQISAKSLVSILEMVRKASETVEVKVYL